MWLSVNKCWYDVLLVQIQIKFCIDILWKIKFLLFSLSFTRKLCHTRYNKTFASKLNNFAVFMQQCVATQACLVFCKTRIIIVNALLQNKIFFPIIECLKAFLFIKYAW